MAVRSSPQYRVPGNPLAGILRDVNRTARRPGGAGQSTFAARLTTDASGTVVWTFPAAFSAVPAVTATADSTAPVVVTMTAVSETSVTVATWALTGSAAQGVTVNLMAVAAA